MSDQSTDPAPTEEPPVNGPGVTTGTASTLDTDAEAAQVGPSVEHTTATGTTVSIPVSEQGTVEGDAEVIENAGGVGAAVDVPAPSAEYNYRPEPIPGPSVEDMRAAREAGIELSSKSSQDLILERAHAQADAIVKAAEDAVAAMDKAEADADAEADGAA